MNSAHLPAVLSSALESNELFVKRYRLHSILGEGGMGVVLAAEDTRLRRQAALKFMKPEFAESPEAREMFLSEARAMAALDHDRIVRVFDVGEFRSLPFLAMELLEGESLDRLLHRGFQFSVRQTLRLGYQISSGLAEAHRAGIIHRDVKPANVVLLMPKGNVKLLDFGLARSSQLAAEWSSQQGSVVTASEGISDAVLVGTPGYLSPEQASDQPIDARSDVYSLGVMLYRILSGRLPFEAATPAEMLIRQLTDEPQPLGVLNDQVPASLSRLVDSCLQREPSRRPGSMDLVTDRLRAAYGESQTSSTITSLASLIDLQLQPRRPQRLATRQTTLRRWSLHRTAFLAGFLLVFAAIIAVLWMRDSRQHSANLRAANAAPAAETPSVSLSENKAGGLSGNRKQTHDPINITDEFDSNVPDALQEAVLIRTGSGDGADTYVQFGSVEDFSESTVLLCSRTKKSEGIPQRQIYLRFDLSALQGSKDQIEDAYLLLTAKKKFFGQRPDFRLNFSVLRDDSPDARWSASGVERIRAGDTPVKVPEIDLIHAGSASGRLSGWFDGRTYLMIRHRNGRLTRTIAEDTDNLLTIVIYNSGEGDGDPEAEFISQEGGVDFSPCLAVLLKKEEGGE